MAREKCGLPSGSTHCMWSAELACFSSIQPASVVSALVTGSYSRHMKDYLNETFRNRWLGRGGPVPWPPRSSDLTPLDFFLWGHMKTLVYETKVDSRASLWDGNHPDNIASAIQSLLIHAENCLANGGGHFEQLL